MARARHTCNYVVTRTRTEYSRGYLRGADTVSKRSERVTVSLRRASSDRSTKLQEPHRSVHRERRSADLFVFVRIRFKGISRTSDRFPSVPCSRRSPVSVSAERNSEERLESNATRSIRPRPSTEFINRAFKRLFVPTFPDVCIAITPRDKLARDVANRFAGNQCTGSKRCCPAGRKKRGVDATFCSSLLHCFLNLGPTRANRDKLICATGYRPNAK